MIETQTNAIFLEHSNNENFVKKKNLKENTINNKTNMLVKNADKSKSNCNSIKFNNEGIQWKEGRKNMNKFSDINTINSQMSIKSSYNEKIILDSIKNPQYEEDSNEEEQIIESNQKPSIKLDKGYNPLDVLDFEAKKETKKIKIKKIIKTEKKTEIKNPIEIFSRNKENVNLEEKKDYELILKDAENLQLKDKFVRSSENKNLSVKDKQLGK